MAVQNQVSSAPPPSLAVMIAGQTQIANTGPAEKMAQICEKLKKHPPFLAILQQHGVKGKIHTLDCILNHTQQEINIEAYDSNGRTAAIPINEIPDPEVQKAAVYLFHGLFHGSFEGTEQLEPNFDHPTSPQASSPMDSGQVERAAQLGRKLLPTPSREPVTPSTESSRIPPQLMDKTHESRCLQPDHNVAALSPPPLPQELLAIINASPAFDGYKIGKGTRYEGISLTTPTIRPANLLYEALLGPNCTTMPGSGELFRFTTPFKRVRDTIQQLAQRDDIVEVHAGGRKLEFVEGRGVDDLTNLYGHGTFRISGQELQATLDSQRIYCSRLLPVQFYRGLKAAMTQDGIVVLPNVKVHQMRGQSAAFIQQVRKNPQNFGFRNREHLKQILGLTMYQLGSLVVKTEDFRVLIDENGKIRERNPGEQDALRLINACGIRNINKTMGTPIPNRTIITEMFSTALEAGESGYFVMPAVGMGVWGGDPAVYWPAFFDAVVNMNVPIERIFVNPGHQEARGLNGSEFAEYLNHYLAAYANNPRALANLQKIVNLFEKKTDIVHLAQNLKRAYPHKIVSEFNASDPDVTKGNHVGEYVNNIGHCSTTEENFTAEGTNGLCFEGITGIHGHPERIIQIH